MTNDKKTDDAAHRARNRTVMLTPDVTGEVRSRLTRDMMQGGQPSAPSQIPTAITSSPTTDDGFRAPSAPPYAGTPMTPPPSAPQHTAPRVAADAEQPLIGFLVSFDEGPKGEYYELRVGRKVVTSDGAAPGNNLVINHPTVSPMHAILRIAANGTVQVLDQLSEHGTLISREGSTEVETLSGEKSTLHNGDKIQFGERLFIVCIIARVIE